MKKVVKIFSLLLLLILVVLIVLPYIYKDDIETYIKEEINKSVNAKVNYQDFDLSLLKDFPKLEVQLSQLTIDGINEFENVRLVDMEKLAMSFDAKKVFWENNFEVNNIDIDQLSLNIIVNKRGKANYDIAKNADSKEENTEKSENPFELKLKRYTLSNSSITYNELSSGMFIELLDINHQGKGKITDQNYLLNTNTSIASTSVAYGTKYLNKAKVNLESEIVLEDNYNKYSFTNPNLIVNNLNIVFNKSMIWLKDDDILMDFSFKTKGTLKHILSLVPPEYLESIENINSNGNAHLTGLVKGTYNTANYPAYKFTLNVDNGTLKHPDLPETVEDINVKALVNFPGGKNLDNTSIELSNIHFRIADNTADGHLNLKNPMSDPDIATSFTSNLDLEKLKNAVPLPHVTELKGMLDSNFELNGKLSAIENNKFNEFQAGGHFNLTNFSYKSDSIPYKVEISSANIEVTPQALKVEKFDSHIDENDFHLTGDVSNYITYFLKKDEILKADFKMHSNSLNLNDFMNNESEPQSEDTKSSGYIKVPDNINVRFKADASKLQYKNMILNDVEGTLNVLDEKASLTAVFLKTLEGQMQLNGSYDTSKEKPISEFDLKMEKMSIVKSASTLSSFQTFAPILQKVQGKFFSDMAMNVELDKNMNPIMNSLDATGTFNTNNLEIQGIDVVKRIGNLLKIQALKNPKVDKIKAQFDIDKGTMHIKPFEFKLNNIKSGFSGSVNLDKQINLILNMDIPREMLGSKPNQLLEGLVGKLSDFGLKTELGEIIKMSFRITGDYNHPKITPHIAGYEGETTKEIITEIVVDKVEEVVDEGVEKARIEAQKQADLIMTQAQQQADLIISKAEALAVEVKKQAKTQGDNLINKAKNPIQKFAAQTAATKLNQEAEKKAKSIIDKAKTNANKVLETAKTKADKLINTEINIKK